MSQDQEEIGSYNNERPLNLNMISGIQIIESRDRSQSVVSQAADIPDEDRSQQASKKASQYALRGEQSPTKFAMAHT